MRSLFIQLSGQCTNLNFWVRCPGSRTVFILSHQEDDITLTLEPEPTSVTPALTPPLQREDATPPGGTSPGQAPAEPMAEHTTYEVTSCVAQSLEEKKEVEDGAAVVVATN